MRLYLSSYRFGSTVDRLLALVPAGARVAVVSNALDLIPDESRRSYARNVHDPLADLFGETPAAEEETPAEDGSVSDLTARIARLEAMLISKP